MKIVNVHTNNLMLKHLKHMKEKNQIKSVKAKGLKKGF